LKDQKSDIGTSDSSKQGKQNTSNRRKKRGTLRRHDRETEKEKERMCTVTTKRLGEKVLYVVLKA